MSGPFLPPKSLMKGLTEDQKKLYRNKLKDRKKRDLASFAEYKANLDREMKQIDRVLALLGEPKRMTPPAKGFKPKIVKTGTDD